MAIAFQAWWIFLLATDRADPLQTGVLCSFLYNTLYLLKRQST